MDNIFCFRILYTLNKNQVNFNINVKTFNYLGLIITLSSLIK